MARAFNRAWGSRRLWLDVLSVALLLEWIPLFPHMPTSGLDQSWQEAINVAAARHLHFGTDIVFTYGPYGAVNTGLYQPGIWGYALPAATLLAVGFVVAMRVWLRDSHWIWSAGFAGATLLAPRAREVLFLCYPLLVVIAVGLLAGRRRRLSWLAAALMVAPLGLLPLVKVSSTVVVAGAMLCLVLLAAQLRRPGLGALALALPPCVTVACWLIAGQPLAGLLDYAWSARSITAGYSEAMSTSSRGSLVDALLALVIGAVVAVFLLRRCRKDRAMVVPSLMLAGTALITAKEAFARADLPHVVSMWPVLAIGLWFVWQAGVAVRWQLMIVATLFVVAVLDVAADPLGTADLGARQAARAVLGPAAAVVHPPWSLRHEYDAAQRRVAADAPLPPVHGTADLYPDNLAALFATQATWDPRPVIQSYSAYTPELARMNRDHLLGSDAPRTLLFSIDPIDNRLPALEDGASWLTILRRYAPTGESAGGYRVLRRTAMPAPVSVQPAVTLAGRLGSWIQLPHTGPGQVLEVSIDVRATALGHARTLLWRPPFITIEVAGDQTVATRRFLPTAAAEPFLISPYIATPEQFVSLYSGGADLSRVSRIRLTSNGLAASAFWSRNVTVTARVVSLGAPRRLSR